MSKRHFAALCGVLGLCFFGGCAGPDPAEDWEFNQPYGVLEDQPDAGLIDDSAMRRAY